MNWIKVLLGMVVRFVRFLYQSVYLALGQIWANKTRSVLTMLGIIIGVASVTAVIAALTGLKARVLTQIESFGTNTIFISMHEPDSGPMQHASGWDLRLKPQHFEGLLEHCPSVERYGCQTWGGRHVVSYRDRTAEEVRSTAPTGRAPDRRSRGYPGPSLVRDGRNAGPSRLPDRSQDP